MDIRDLRFSECAYFYKLKNGMSISDEDIHKMLVQVTEGKIRRGYLFDLERQSFVVDVYYSIRVFKCKPEMPSFITKNEDGWKELKIGYYIFIEYLDYVVILRRNATVPKFISEKLDNIDYDKLIALKANARTSFKKLSIQNLDGSNSAMRNKTFEALNLSENVPTMGINRYFVRSVKGENGDDDKFSLTLSASRINEFHSDLTVSDLCGWAKRKIDEINGLGQMQKNLLSAFAFPEKYSAIYKRLVPKSVLIFSSLLSSLNDDNPAQLLQIDENGGETPMTENGVELMIGDMSKAYTTVISQVINNKTHYYIGNNNSIEIRILSSGIKLDCEAWKKIIIRNSSNGAYDGTLYELINNHHLFNVYFTDVELVYSNRTVFRDKKLLTSINQFMKVLLPIPSLNNTNHEKHNRGRRSLVGLQDWSQDSVFHVVEQEFMGNYTHFICDDCNDEWADHIGISEDRVTFFCSKHKNSLDSASDFQEVVGQALKNLANLSPTHDQLAQKMNSWGGPYQTSNIQRLRSNNGTIQDAVRLWEENTNSPNFERCMCLVVDFMQRQRFESQLYQMQATYPNNIDSELYQRLWLLSSFINGCLDMGVKPIIYCRT